MRPLTARYGLVGHPVAHSLSPTLFQWMSESTGHPCTYSLVDRPPEALTGFLTSAGMNFDGLNVTVPHKVAAATLCARRSPAAEATGAVNAVRFHPASADGGWVIEGTNTDVDGFAFALGERRPSIATVLGAGGAARAVVAALTAIGTPEIRLVNRSSERAVALVRAMASTTAALVAFPWTATREACRDANLVVQATSAGLADASALPILPWSTLGPDAVAMDLVYRPRRTPFLQSATAAGLATVDGLDMLAGQAVGALAFFRRADVPGDARALAVGLAARLRAAVD